MLLVAANGSRSLRGNAHPLRVGSLPVPQGRGTEHLPHAKSSHQVLAVVFWWGAYAQMVEELQLANRVSTDPHHARSFGLITPLLIAICGETNARGILSID
jgi:hypothetical protein